MFLAVVASSVQDRWPLGEDGNLALTRSQAVERVQTLGSLVFFAHRPTRLDAQRWTGVGEAAALFGVLKLFHKCLPILLQVCDGSKDFTLAPRLAKLRFS